MINNARAKKSTIFSRLLGGYIALTVLIVLLTSAVSYFLIRNYTMRNTMDGLLEKAGEIAEMMATPSGKTRILLTSRFEEIQVLADAQVIYVEINAQNQLIARYIPYRQSGAEFEESAFQSTNIVNTLDAEMVMSILSGTPTADIRKIEFMDITAVFAGAPVRTVTDDVSGAVILCRPFVDVSAIIYGIISMEGLAGILALLIAAILAYMISRALVRPIKRLTLAAERVAEGHYGETTEIERRDEIGQLGGTLNLLSVRLRNVIGSLSDEKIKLQQMLASLGEGIVAVDVGGKVVHLNGAAASLLELADNVKDDPIAAHPQLVKMLRGAIADGGIAHAQWQNARGITVDATVSPFLSADGEIIGAVGLLRDVSESERLERLRRDYIANISHELRTPLTGIRGMVEPLIDGLMETEGECVESYTIIYQETLRLEKLIGDMLDLSRLQDGRAELRLEPMTPGGLIEAAMRRFTARAAEQGVKLSIETPDEELVLMGEEDRIVQVLTILTDNALSFTPPGGEVTLFARRGEGRALLGVRDTGAGIDPSDLPYIWERFFKADRSRMRTSGTGLGLAIAKLVVELMNGEIWVETEPGQGSTFTFSLELGDEWGSGI